MNTKLIDSLRKEYSSWISVLTEEEKKAIRKYSYNSFDEKPNRFSRE